MPRAILAPRVYLGLLSTETSTRGQLSSRQTFPRTLILVSALDRWEEKKKKKQQQRPLSLYFSGVGEIFSWHNFHLPLLSLVSLSLFVLPLRFFRQSQHISKLATSHNSMLPFHKTRGLFARARILFSPPSLSPRLQDAFFFKKRSSLARTRFVSASKMPGCFAPAPGRLTIQLCLKQERTSLS